MEVAASGRAPGEAALEVLRANAALMREQIGLARNERFRNRIKAFRDLALAASVAGVVGAAALTLWNANEASGLVVEALTVPPALAAQGMDGTVLAGRLLDRLSAMQAATDSARAPATFGSNWGNDLSVEVPQTGVSAGDLWRTMRQTLGDETRLSGDLFEKDGILTLTTRVGSNPGRSISGNVSELDRLIDDAAQAIFRQAQPYRYSVWLNRDGGGASDEIWRELAASGDRTEQLWALVGLSVSARFTDPELALSFARQALAMDPTFHKARWNVSDALSIMGRQEENLHEVLLTERAMRRRDRRVTKTAQDQVLHNARTTIARYTGDFAAVVEEARVRAALPDYGGHAVSARYELSWAFTALHDRSAAREALMAAGRSGQSLPEAAALSAALAAEERGDLVAAAEHARIALVAAIEFARPQLPNVPPYQEWRPESRAAMALIFLRSGDRATGLALLSNMRADCYPCVIAHGQVAQFDGNFIEAERLLLRATVLGPSLPAAWQDLGEARLERGDRVGAISAFAEAAERGPRWADPLKFWGDALAADGDHRSAIAKYRAAAERAPRWGAAHLAWGRSLAALGRHEEARRKYSAAAGMELTIGERAELAQSVAASRARS